ncbi:MAG: Hsp70 family protein [Lachnospiraceae bacterium]|nr:Hsp70 family protein [Lachnospiraceae bacterium]
MERFFGFDLGDAESAVCVLRAGEKQPQVLPVRGNRSFISAYARTESGELLIGEDACYAPGALVRRLRFKSRFLADPETDADVRSFAAGVLTELRQDGRLSDGEDTCVYVGCPAGWDKADRERYRAIFERAGYPPVRIISESRAALVNACQSRHLQVGYDILKHPVLVVDVGSSTTDFAFISGGREVELKTAGEVALGGGLMDEALLSACVDASQGADRIRRFLEEKPAWKSYCEFAARRLKEKYFSDPAYWKENACTQVVKLKPLLKLTLRMDAAMAEKLVSGPLESLSGRSFEETFLASLRQVAGKLGDTAPELIFLTGGVSRMSQVADWCREVFPDAVTITGPEPEFSVTRGLALCGGIDEELRAFRSEVEELRDSSVVERIVQAHVSELYQGAVDELTEPLLREAVLPVISRWRSGEIGKLAEIDGVLEEEITNWLHTDRARELLAKPVASWLRQIGFELEEHTVPICVRRGVPYRALSLTSHLAVSEIDVKVEAKNVFAVEEITWMIDTIISLLVGLLCGGSGVALIAGGLPGIVAGAVVSLLVLLLGKNKMQKLMLNTNVPAFLRKLTPMSYFESRIRHISEEVKASFRRSLAEEKNEEIIARMAEDISQQIDTCLMKMAEVVEIPLG